MGKYEFWTFFNAINFNQINMKLSKQVTSLELSQKMKDLGFAQESLFWWCSACRKTFYFEEKDRNEPCPQMSGRDPMPHFFISAYTCSELGDMLKEYSGNMPHYVRGQECWAKAVDKGENNDFEFVESDTEVDCRAKMLIHLKKNNLICNQNIK